MAYLRLPETCPMTASAVPLPDEFRSPSAASHPPAALFVPEFPYCFRSQRFKFEFFRL